MIRCLTRGKSMQILDMIYENKNRYLTYLSAKMVQSPVGDILIIVNKDKLCLLEFVQRKNLRDNLINLSLKTDCPIVWSDNSLIKKIENALGKYFQGKENQFDLPIETNGTPFQKKVWQEIQKIPYGQTTSYAEIAISIGFTSAHRAVANAVGKNQLAIIVPCHRVINKSGKLGGYAGGIDRKEWLLSHEKSPEKMS